MSTPLKTGAFVNFQILISPPPAQNPSPSTIPGSSTIATSEPNAAANLGSGSTLMVLQPRTIPDPKLNVSTTKTREHHETASSERYIKDLINRAKARDLNACLNLARCYETGTHLSQDLDKAIKFYERAARLNSLAAKRKLVILYYKDLSDKKAVQRSIDLCTEIATINEDSVLKEKNTVDLIAEANYFLGVFWIKNHAGFTPQPQLGVLFLENAIRLGHARACRDLGICYETGQGNLKPSLKKAIEYYRMGAERGCKRALKKWILLLMDAAKMGKASAYLDLGKCFEEGRGVKRSTEAAGKLYLAAVKGGSVPALKELQQWCKKYVLTKEIHDQIIACFSNPETTLTADIQLQLGEILYTTGMKGRIFTTKDHSLSAKPTSVTLIPIDPKKGLSLIKKLAKEGHAKAREFLNNRKEKFQKKSFERTFLKVAVKTKPEKLSELAELAKPAEPVKSTEPAPLLLSKSSSSSAEKSTAHKRERIDMETTHVQTTTKTSVGHPPSNIQERHHKKARH